MKRTIKRGLVQIYTGAGKGKTTAALGLALRASGAGFSVYVQQFIKGSKCSEMRSLAMIDRIKIDQCGHGCFIKGKPGKDDVEYARRGLARARRMMVSGKYDLVILDEVNNAIQLGLIKSDEVLDVITAKPRTVELVLTGRGCPKMIMEHADLITEMKKIRHPFDKGIAARRGIEY